MATPIPDNHVRMSVYGVRAATAGAVLHLHSETVAEGMTSDSRRVVAGNVFVALQGEAFDGHDHVGAAIAAGAHTVVVNHGRGAGITGANVVEVRDTLRAWGALGRAHLRGWRRGNAGRRVIAITGSSGKTSTKEWVAGLLAQRAPTQATLGNLNNLIGVPATCFTVTEAHSYAVIEAGMSVPGEIAALGSYLRPDISVLGNIGLAHVAQLGSRAGVAREKGALFATVRDDGVAIANADDVAVMGELLRTRAATALTFGAGVDAAAARPDVRLLRRARGAAGATSLSYELPVGAVDYELSLEVSQVQALNLGAAIAVYWAIFREAPSLAHVAEAARRVGTGGRGELQRGLRGSWLIDDTYNANPDSVRAALVSLAERGEGQRTVAVLGEMRELGQLAQQAHREVGQAVHSAGVSELVTLGGEAGHIADAARELGVRVHACDGLDEAYTHLAAALQAGDVVLFKASRGVAAERLLERLKEGKA